MTVENHLDFNELVDYIWCQEVNPTALLLAQRVNAHIAGCDACRDEYNLLLNLYEQVQTYQEMNTLNEEQRTALKALIEEQAQIGNKQAWERCLSKLGAFAVSFSLSIERGEKLLLSHMKNFNPAAEYSFGYPVLLGVRSAESEEEGKKNILIDDENELNQIIHENGMITIQLDAAEWNGKTPDLLVMNDDGKIRLLDAFERHGECFVKQIPDDNAKYNIYVG